MTYRLRMDDVKVMRTDRWRLKIERQGAMRTSGIVYADEHIEKMLMKDQALKQVANVACLPGIVGPSMAMPDIHWGYGFPIGGVAAFSLRDGIVSPGGVGYDINCGIRCIRTILTADEVKHTLERLIPALFGNVPSGVGSRNRAIRLSQTEIRQVMTQGAGWAVRQGFGPEDDLKYHEDNGCMKDADPDEVSKKAVERGLPELGTLGSGNHFLEIDIVDEIFDRDAAAHFGLFDNQVLVQVHTGSRGLGHQVCDDYVHSMIAVAAREGIYLPDRQLACAPLGSKEAARYLGAMASAANFAYANREIITSLVRRTFEKIFSRSSERLGMSLLYDCCHNIAKKEKVRFEGREIEVCVHRKGATRAIAAGDRSLPERFMKTGQPVLVPGDMGRASYILAGQAGAEATFFSACHGAGRLLSRGEAKRQAKNRSIIEELRSRDIQIMSASRSTIDEEIPEAYKDVSMVVETVTGAGIASKVARLRPLGIIKG